AVLIVRGEKRPRIERQSVGSPVSGEVRFWPLLGRTLAHCFPAITAVLGGKHQLRLLSVEVAGRPTVVAVLLDLQQLFRGQILSLVGRVQLRPTLGELISSVLG